MSRRIFTSAFSYWRSPSRHNDNRSISFLKNIFGGKEKECKSYENVEETKREPPNPNKLNPKCCIPSQPPTLPDTCGTYKSFEWFDPTQTEGSMKIKQVLMGNASPVVAPPSICKGKSTCKPPNPPAAPPVENNKGSIFALPSCPMPCVVPPCCPPPSPGCPQPPSFAPKCPCPPPPKCPPPCCPPPPKCPPPCCPPPPKCPPPCCPPPPKCPPPCPPPCCPPPKCPPPCPPPKCPPPCPPPPKCPPPCPPKCPPPCPPPCPCPPPPKCPPPPCCPPPPKCPPPCCPPPPKCPPPCCPPPPKCPPPPCCPPPPKCPPPPCCPPPPKCPPPCPPPCCPPPPKCPPPPCCPPPPKCPPPPCCPPPPKCPPPCPPKCPKCSGVSAEAIELRECSSCGPSLNLFSLNSARESLLQAFVLKGNREYSKNVNETNGNISLLSKPMENSPRSINIEEIINSKEVKLERRKSVDFKSLGNREMGSTVTVKEVKMRLDGEQGKKLTRRFSLPEFLTTSKKYSTTPAKTCNNSLTSSNNVEAGAADLFPLFSEYPKQELNLKNPGFHLSYNLDSFLTLPNIWAKTPVNKSKIST